MMDFTASDAIFFKLFGDSHSPLMILSRNLGDTIAMIALFIFALVILYGLAAAAVDFNKRPEHAAWPTARIVLAVMCFVPSTDGLMVGQVLITQLVHEVSQKADDLWRDVLMEASENGLLNIEPIKGQGLKKINAYVSNVYNYSVCAQEFALQVNPKQKDFAKYSPVLMEKHEEATQYSSNCQAAQLIDDIKGALKAEKPKMPAFDSGKYVDGLPNQDQENAFYKYVDDLRLYQASKLKIKYADKAFKAAIKNKDKRKDAGVGLASVQKIVREYSSEFDEKMSAVDVFVKRSKTVNMVEAMSRQGWISAGIFYKQLAHLEEERSKALNDSTNGMANFTPLADRKYVSTEEVMAESEIAARNTLGIWVGDFIEGFESSKTGATRDPVLVAVDYGNRMIVAGEALLALRLAADKVQSGLSSIPVIGKIASWGVSLLTKGTGAAIAGVLNIYLIVLGGLLAFVIPMLPAILFLFAVMSYVIHVVETLICVPFWLIANALPGAGSLITNVGRKGINNVIYIATYPLLIISAFVVAQAMTWIGMSLINSFFQDSLALAYPGFNPAGLIKLALSLTMYLMCSWMMITNCFSLMQSLPRAVYGWISDTMPGLNPLESKLGTAQSVVANVSQLSGRYAGDVDGAFKSIDSMAEKASDRARKVLARQELDDLGASDKAEKPGTEPKNEGE